ncbi:RpiR family transcriptional regulator [Intrasporangium oryzae NRRL B-24470]|uniref:RpiR family transcriptional regulator n=1 Tax=Intrasporangium oryzae NRRL B-24470 TaxID=1386089 RepID=W9GDZ9_9MICO|nr:MurR/RpiR family transcriptional regulator [Intrasporangium oryzae]EWT02079.1 RpiR family transcriptional regulator [Intrasporangium oryzae NRRL B-24470]
MTPHPVAPGARHLTGDSDDGTAAPAGGQGLADTIRRRLGECSPSERKVARVLLAAYPSAGFETVARLAVRAGVSGPTVIRFVNRLGYAGYPDFQQALRDDLDARNASPLSLYDASAAARAGAGGSDADALLEHAARVAADSMARTFGTIAPHDLARAIELLSSSHRRIHLSGGRFSGLLARFLCQHLEQLRSDVRMLPDTVSSRAAVLADLGARDVIVVFDFRRYEPEALQLARFARSRHASVLLFTDVFLSPIASEAEVVLAADIGSPSPYDAMAPSLAVVETVLAGVVSRLGEDAHARMGRVEQVAGELELY